MSSLLHRSEVNWRQGMLRRLRPLKLGHIICLSLGSGGERLTLVQQ